MGSKVGDNKVKVHDHEKPDHPVRLDDFYLGEFAVTQDLWEAIMGNNPSDFKGARRPVENVSWDIIQKDFLPKLNQLTGQNYRLPTVAEWEYAAAAVRIVKSKNTATPAATCCMRWAGMLKIVAVKPKKWACWIPTDCIYMT